MSTVKSLSSINFPAYKTSQSTKKAKKNLSSAGSTQRKQVIASLQNAAKKSTTPYENDIQSSFDKGLYAGADMAEADTTAYAQGLTAGYGDTYIDPTISQSFNKYRGARDNYIPQLMTAAQSAYYGDKSANYNLASTLQGEEADRFNRANAILQSRSNNDNMKYELGNTAAQTKFNKLTSQLSLEQAARARSSRSSTRKNKSNTKNNKTTNNKTTNNSYSRSVQQEKIDPFDSKAMIMSTLAGNHISTPKISTNYSTYNNLFNEALKQLGLNKKTNSVLITPQAYVKTHGDIIGYADYIEKEVSRLKKNNKNKR